MNILVSVNVIKRFDISTGNRLSTHATTHAIFALDGFWASVACSLVSLWPISFPLLTNHATFLFSTIAPIEKRYEHPNHPSIHPNTHYSTTFDAMSDRAYQEILEACRPFYTFQNEAERNNQESFVHILPRLEDALQQQKANKETELVLEQVKNVRTALQYSSHADIIVFLTYCNQNSCVARRPPMSSKCRRNERQPRSVCAMALFPRYQRDSPPLFSLSNAMFLVLCYRRVSFTEVQDCESSQVLLTHNMAGWLFCLAAFWFCNAALSFHV